MKKSKLLLLIILFCQISNSQIIRTIKEESEINGFSMDYEGRILVTSTRNIIKVWNTTTGEMVTTFSTSAPIKSLSIDHNGLYMASSEYSWGSTNDIKIWNISIGRGVAIKHTHTDKVTCVLISPDNSMIATGSEDETIKIFDFKTYKELVTLNGHKDVITSLAFSSDSKYLLSGSKDKTAKLWDLQKNIDLITYDCDKKKVYSVALSPDSKYVAIGCDDNSVRLFSFENGKMPENVFLGHKGKVNSLAFTPDNKFLASGSDDKLFKIWNLSTGKEVYLRLGVGVNHTKAIWSLAFSSTGKLFTMSEDNTVKFWNWGFPILQATDLKINDANGNQKIEGTEETTLSLNIVNSGYGEALKVKFKLIDKNKVDGLTYTSDIFLGDIPAKSTKHIDIPIKASQQLKESESEFAITELTSLSNQPLPALEASIKIPTVAIPLLVINIATFSDADSNSVLSGREEGKIDFTIKNEGAGRAKTLKANLTISNQIGLDISDEVFIGDIEPSSEKNVSIPVFANKELPDGVAVVSFKLSDNNGITEEKFEVKIRTKKYIPTLKEEIKEYVETRINDWQRKGKFERTEEFRQRVNDDTRKKKIELLTQEAIDTLALQHFKWEQALTEYDADNESFKIIIPDFTPIYIKIPLSNAQDFDKSFKKLESKNSKFTIAENNFALLHTELIDNQDSTKKFIFDSQDMVAFNSTQLNFDFDPINVDIPQDNNLITNTNVNTRILKVGKSDVDMNIPETGIKNPNAYALIIGNEDYSSYQSGLNSEINVDFAVNDAKIFKEYAQKVIGIPEENITLKTNATLGQMKQSIIKLMKLAELSNGNAEIYLYYSGHGLPDESTKEGYIMPVDISGTEIKSAIKLNDLYTQLTQYPTKHVTVILDACFSGGARNASLIAMKGVKVKPKEEELQGNLIVATSSSGEESSSVYREKQHGMFTYFLLQKLQETKGNIDYRSLFEQVTEKVKLQSILLNNKEQTPQVLASPQMLPNLGLVKIVEPK